MLRFVFDAFKNYRGFRRGPAVGTVSMFEQPLKFFVVFFVVVEPVSLIPLFTGLTAGATGRYKRRMALKAVGVSALILLLFALGGAAFLKLMGISLEAFRIFGGLLLFLLALEMVFARESGTRTSSSEAAESRRRSLEHCWPRWRSCSRSHWC
jgi:small neutral amino acid transporter SnatA (MarC family)